MDGLFQFFALTRKNALLYLRNWKTSVCTLALPFICIVLLKLFIVGIGVNIRNSHKERVEIHHPPVLTVGMIPKCKQIEDRVCTTILYSPNNDTYVTTIVENVLKNSGLDEKDYLGFYNETYLVQHMLDHPNTSSIAVDFTINQRAGVKYIAYNIYYNGTVIQQDQFSQARLPVIITEVQLAVDNAIYRMEAKDRGLSQATDRFIDVLTKDFPTALPVNRTAPPNPFDNVDIEGTLMSFIGVFFIQISLALWWTVHLYYMTQEKAKQLRFNLTSMGTSWFVYQASHIFTALVLMAITCFVSIISGYIVQIPFFTRSNFVCLYIVYFCFGVGTLGIMNLIGSIVSNQKVARMLEIIRINIVVIIAFIINGLASVASVIAGNGIIVYFLYASVPKAAWVLTVLPAFNFAKCIADIATNSYSTILSSKTTGYGWYEWAHPIQIKLFDSRIPASFESCIYMVLAGILCSIIGLYLDLILPTSCNGSPLPFYFFLSPNYWRPKASIEQFRATAHQAKSVAADTQIAEHVDLALDTDSALRIIQLRKKFGSVEAVKGISLTAQEGTCLAVLGHNGAGKTTTVNTLLGQTNPTDGTALVFGMDVRAQQNNIRKVMGACPQFDVLYDTMTAREHCWVYGIIKGLRGAALTQEIETRLKEVGLWSVRDKQSSTFSGGMKRRLSVAIAFIGNPRVVLLDEPTTGLDPKSKRLIWNLVHRMKKEKLIVLTTHSMEEAEKLSDQIVIMAFGEIKCIGNSLSLKTRFGAGYNLTLISNSPQFVKDLVARHVRAVLVSENGPSLMFNVPDVTMGDLIPLVREIEKNQLIRDWALSQTTLEEVYLRVTDQSHFGYNSQNMRTH